MNTPATSTGGAPAPYGDIDETLAVFNEIHRDPESFVALQRKRDGKWEPIAQERVGDFREMFPEIMHFLVHDSYWSPNGYFAAKTRKDPATGALFPVLNPISGRPEVRRDEKALRRLNACFVDIDSGRDEGDEVGARLHYREVLYRVGVLADLRLIPHPSIMARSGRGVYLLWLLNHARLPDESPRGFDREIGQYKRINKALGWIVKQAGLPADKRAHDAARVLRIHGSINSKAPDVPVAYTLQYLESGKIPRYTLDELAAAIGQPGQCGELPAALNPNTPAPKVRSTKEKGSRPSGIKGLNEIGRRRAASIVRLSNYRGGFLKAGKAYPDGHISQGRFKALSNYALSLRQSGLDRAAVLDAVAAMAQTTRPPMGTESDDQTPEQIVRAVFPPNEPPRIRDSTLASMFGVTPDMARELELNALLPDEVREERKAAKPSRKKIKAAMVEWSREYLKGRGSIGCRLLLKALVNAGFPIAEYNQETANQILKTIRGKEAPRAKPGRPRKAESEQAAALPLEFEGVKT